MEIGKEVLAAIVGAFGGILAGLVSGGLAARATLKSKQVDRVLEEIKLWVGAYETKMLEQRLVDYKKLWSLTEQTSRRRIHLLSPQEADALVEELLKWYYRDGGIVLSENSRDEFFEARSSLESPERKNEIKNWHVEVVKRFSALRSALCEDLNSRRAPRQPPTEREPG